MTELAVSPKTPASAGRPDGSVNFAPATSPALATNHIANRNRATSLIRDLDDVRRSRAAATKVNSPSAFAVAICSIAFTWRFRRRTVAFGSGV